MTVVTTAPGRLALRRRPARAGGLSTVSGLGLGVALLPGTAVADALAAAGGLVFLWATGQSINAVSLIGIVVMIGIVDNEAVVKLDAIRRFREMGHSIHDAVLLGGRQRLRAITMTSLTTIFGVLPLVFGFGSGGALYQPLAAAVIGGAIGAQLVTFFLLPVAYAVLEQWKDDRAERSP